jgi:hypothetical protein
MSNFGEINQRAINELAVMAKVNDRLGKPATAMDAIAREITLIKLLKDKTDDEVKRLTDTH